MGGNEKLVEFGELGVWRFMKQSIPITANAHAKSAL